MKHKIKLESTGIKDTMAIARIIGRHLLPGSVVCLTGELGTGKTCFVKGLAEGLGINSREVTSPTFIIIREYRGRIPLYHIDLYRIGFIEDIRDIGMEEVVYGTGVTAIEWAERIRDVLPDERIDITLKWGDEKCRLIELKAAGLNHSKMLREAEEEFKNQVMSYEI